MVNLFLILKLFICPGPASIVTEKEAMGIRLVSLSVLQQPQTTIIAQALSARFIHVVLVAGTAWGPVPTMHGILIGGIPNGPKAWKIT